MAMTTAIAIYAALISTTSLIWQIYIWGRNRYCILITADIEPAGLHDLNRSKIFIRVINTGRETVTIVKSGFQLRKINNIEEANFQWLPGGKGSPITLQPGASFEHTWEEEILDTSPLRGWAKDALRNVFFSPWVERKL